MPPKAYMSILFDLDKILNLFTPKKFFDFSK